MPSVTQQSVSNDLSVSNLSASIPAVSCTVTPAPAVAVSSSAVCLPVVSCENVSTDFSLTPAPLDIPSRTYLQSLYFVLPCGSVFIDKQIPQKFDTCPPIFRQSSEFNCDYFVDLHNHVVSTGKYNYAGARIELSHNTLMVDRFRELLPQGFEDLAVLQYMQFGFPLGLKEDFILQPSLKNHSSSYEYFTHIDKFVVNELKNCGITGAFLTVHSLR